MSKIKYIETHVNTLYLNYYLEYKGTQYNVCVDWAGGVQDIEIKNIYEDNDYFESLYDKIDGVSDEDRKEIIAIVEEALDQTDFNSNVTFSN